MSARSRAAPWYRERYPYRDVGPRMFAEVVRAIQADSVPALIEVLVRQMSDRAAKP